jgi:hypothetical protein
MHTALSHLRQARGNLYLAERMYPNAQPRALEQTNYAIEQVYAALGNDTAKARDQQEAAKDRAEAERNVGEQKKDGRDEMHAALKHLQSARTELQRIPADVYGERRSRTLTYVNQAISDVEAGLKEGPHR